MDNELNRNYEGGLEGYGLAGSHAHAIRTMQRTLTYFTGKPIGLGHLGLLYDPHKGFMHQAFLDPLLETEEGRRYLEALPGYLDDMIEPAPRFPGHSTPIRNHDELW